MRCPQPNRFIAAIGVSQARILKARPAFIDRHRVTGARRRGVLYEAKALNRLEELKPSTVEFLRSPWIEFQDEHGKRWCQPDAVMLDATQPVGCVFEVKYKHCSEAWFQLWRLYIPVLERLYPEKKWQAVEVVKWFDPATSFPERFHLTDNPFRIPENGKTAVHIYNPARG